MACYATFAPSEYARDFDRESRAAAHTKPRRGHSIAPARGRWHDASDSLADRLKDHKWRTVMSIQ